MGQCVPDPKSENLDSLKRLYATYDYPICHLKPNMKKLASKQGALSSNKDYL